MKVAAIFRGPFQASGILKDFTFVCEPSWSYLDQQSPTFKSRKKHLKRMVRQRDNHRGRPAPEASIYWIDTDCIRWAVNQLVASRLFWAHEVGMAQTAYWLGQSSIHMTPTLWDWRVGLEMGLEMGLETFLPTILISTIPLLPHSPLPFPVKIMEKTAVSTLPGKDDSIWNTA